MSGITFVESTTVEATTGHMLITFNSGGEKHRYYLPANVALRFRQLMLQDGWQILCAPDADVVPLKPGGGKAGRR